MRRLRKVGRRFRRQFSSPARRKFYSARHGARWRHRAFVRKLPTRAW